MINPKSEYLNTKQIGNSNSSNPKRYDLEDRTYLFAKRVRLYVKNLPRNITNIEDCKQLTRSSGSMGANYIEANESLSKKDFILRVKICKKETKETIYWLKLVDIGNNNDSDRERDNLIREATELMKIFGSIVEKSTKSEALGSKQNIKLTT